jgi:hypothetical protein
MCQFGSTSAGDIECREDEMEASLGRIDKAGNFLPGCAIAAVEVSSSCRRFGEVPASIQHLNLEALYAPDVA